VTVLDASAVLALLHDEAGAEAVQGALEGSVLGAPNLAEVIGKLVDAGVDPAPVRGLLAAAGVEVEPLTAADAVNRIARFDPTLGCDECSQKACTRQAPRVRPAWS